MMENDTKLLADLVGTESEKKLVIRYLKMMAGEGLSIDEFKALQELHNKLLKRLNDKKQK